MSVLLRVRPPPRDVQRHAWYDANPQVNAIAEALPKRANPQVLRLPFELDVPAIRTTQDFF